MDYESCKFIHTRTPSVGKQISVSYEGQTKTIRSENPLFLQAEEAFFAKDWETFFTYLDPAVLITKGNVKVENGTVYYKDEKVHGVIVDRILAFLSEKADMDHLLLFLDNLMSNPSARAREELYTFLENKGFPITSDGCFLAYKSVRPDWTDWATGKFSNKIGETLEMPRDEVDPDKTKHCSYGFHAGTYEYASNFNGGVNLVLVKINPGDVVSIPEDCECQKLRTCKYEVIESFIETKPIETAYYGDYEDTEDEKDEYYDLNYWGEETDDEDEADDEW